MNHTSRQANQFTIIAQQHNSTYGGGLRIRVDDIIEIKSAVLSFYQRLLPFIYFTAPDEINAIAGRHDVIKTKEKIGVGRCNVASMIFCNGIGLQKKK